MRLPQLLAWFDKGETAKATGHRPVIQGSTDPPQGPYLLPNFYPLGYSISLDANIGGLSYPFHGPPTLSCPISSLFLPFPTHPIPTITVTLLPSLSFLFLGTLYSPCSSLSHPAIQQPQQRLRFLPPTQSLAKSGPL